MSDKVLIYSRFPKSMMTRVAQRFELIDAAGKPPAEIFDAAELAEVRALITAGGQPLGRDVLDTLPSLGAIICYGTGYDGVDLKTMAERNIVLGNSPAANASAVADLAMTLLLALTRRLLPADAYLRAGGWAQAKPSPLLRPPRGLSGRRIGVYGMGEIGRKIALRAAAFETEVGYHSRSRHDVPYAYHASLEALVEWCDVLVIAVRAGPDTKHIIDAAMLKRLGAEGSVINISRGSVIDQAALVAALSDNTIAGAGLDVFEVEPQAPDALTALPNVVLTPHIGGHTAEAHIAMQDCVIENLTAFFAGRALRYPVG
ncbi:MULTISPECIES: 2-hydroxyacid dehydrogenase [Rhodopseudomonas]|uniref:2-hydroxyacid dehydrogenase n=1 Tax=Rhodopseudomonas palustris TaxID=1076 RepID=A0A0D7E4K9_RHOPL|nr:MULTISPECIES: 2-hydroxyacid dehydrogenase [Rhodopseudomonas]KIZ35466.1 2-hydroxyacid dehydrogenase [Rhodopseudomonas palustris]MDF3812913.1 2-hydroxyacid dehydrogenase [Rhodopseudomonas sp. BAL398]WOK18508.1 2-hydroxyacid dehydrogenase [Rhodopseudomonas sp. BAL398]